MHTLVLAFSSRTTRGASIGVLITLVALSFWRTSRAPRTLALVPPAHSQIASASANAVSDVPYFIQELMRLRAEPPSDARNAQLASLLIRESHRNPTLVARAILRETDISFQEACFDEFIDHWAAQFPAEAAAWLLTTSRPERGYWASAIIIASAETPSALSEFVLRLASADKEGESEYLRMALRALVDVGDFSLAPSFIVLSRDPLSRGALREQLVSDWTRIDAPAAAAWVRTLTDSPERDVLLGRLVETWSATEPRAAATFSASLPEGLGRTNALTLAVTAWASRDVVSASTWLANQVDSSELDTPIFALATDPALAAAHPSVAALWAESISNPDVRLQGLRAVLEHWFLQDAEAARRFLLATPALSEQFRRTLLAEIDRG
jgi:hypothetical protein